MGGGGGGGGANRNSFLDGGASVSFVVVRRPDALFVPLPRGGWVPVVLLLLLLEDVLVVAEVVFILIGFRIVALGSMGINTKTLLCATIFVR